MRWWLVAVLGVLSGPGTGTAGCGAPRCPPGEEPVGACGLAQTCRLCPPGAFSPGDVPCAPHTRCHAANRLLLAPGTAAADSRCGGCVHRFYSPDGEREPRGRCLPCSAAPPSTPGCPGQRQARSAAAALRGPAGSNGTREARPEEAAAAQSAVLAIVPIFCAMGLLGILVCNLLKKKGYHCTAHKETDPGAGTGPSSVYQIEDANEDTIGVLVRLITEKKENAAALEELLKEHHSAQLVAPGCKPAYKLHLLPQFPSACRHQQHLHTVHGPAPPSDPPCTRCSQKKWPQVLPSPGNATKATKPGAKAGRPGEITILSVGRFRVSRIPEQKPGTAAGTGGDPSRGPLPAGSGTRPSWLKSTESRPEGSPSAARLGDSTLAM
ncbi:tumor necrosis factor receptor superfamily member 19L isoform X1 [Anser cygnoides]|uniref:tumor necrosis factor receptor superfamily member 19L isoform X1 n=2 Tax=Anser cygnoides TaxID=8845 RepID=UPI0034D29508